MLTLALLAIVACAAGTIGFVLAGYRPQLYRLRLARDRAGIVLSWHCPQHAPAKSAKPSTIGLVSLD